MGQLFKNHKIVDKSQFDIVSAKIDLKLYYVLLIKSALLLQLRRRYALPDMLNFKGYAIGFHITIGVTAAPLL